MLLRSREQPRCGRQSLCMTKFRPQQPPQRRHEQIPIRMLIAVAGWIAATAAHALAPPRMARMRTRERALLPSQQHAWSLSSSKDVTGAMEIQRRELMTRVWGATSLVLWPSLARAASLERSTLFTRETSEFAYVFAPPAGFAGPSQKPLKTHLDEVNFASAVEPGYQFGITVDPVRITSLTDFGTPEQVAAKVVLAEVNRDGVLTVTLVDDPVARRSTNDDDRTLYYQLNYISSGKRGDKRFVAKFFIQNQKLYALTAQCKEDMYSRVQQGLLDAVDSFRILM